MVVGNIQLAYVGIVAEQIRKVLAFAYVILKSDACFHSEVPAAADFG